MAGGQLRLLQPCNLSVRASVRELYPPPRKHQDFDARSPDYGAGPFQQSVCVSSRACRASFCRVNGIRSRRSRVSAARTTGMCEFGEQGKEMGMARPFPRL